MATKKQVNAEFQLELAGITANMSVSQNYVHVNAHVPVNYRLDRKTGVIEYVGAKTEPSFSAIKSAIEAEMKAANTEYAELIAVPTPIQAPTL